MNNNETNNGLNSQVLGGVTDNTVNNPEPQSNVVQNTPVQSEVLGGVNTNASDVSNPINNSDNAYHAGTVESPSATPNVVIDPTVNAAPEVNNTVNTQAVNSGVTNPQVEPAYTNPQTINPQPSATPNNGMPGFESSSVIGTTPPVSLEPEKKPKKKGSNKILFIILILVVIAAVGGGTYYVLNSGILNSNTAKVSIETKEVSINVGDAIPTDVSTYATISGTTISNCSVNVDKVDNYTEGIYEYTVTCGEEVKSGNVTVVDNTELTLYTQMVYKGVGETVEASEFVINADSTVTYEFVNEDEIVTDLQTEGTYTVEIKATSGSKTTTSTATLIVLTASIKGYVTCKSSEQTVTDISATLVVKDTFALLDDDNNSYAGIAYETYEYTFTDQEIYTNYVNEYYANGYIVINDVTGTIGFDDDNLIIDIVKGLNNDDVISDYGEENMNNYSTITSYFVNQKGYKCSYSKAE